MDKKLRLSLIFQAAGNATNFLKGVGRQSDRTAQAVKAARDRVTELQRATRNVQSYRQMETRLGATRDELAAARLEAARLAQAHAAAERPTRQLSRAFDLAKTKVRELKAQEEGQTRALQDLRGQLSAAGISTKNLGAWEQRLARQIREANSELTEQTRRMDAVSERQKRLAAARGSYDSRQELAGSMQGAGSSAVAGGLAIAAPMVLAARQAMSFEDAMADVRKVVDFPTPRSFTAMSDALLDMSGRLPVAKEELAAIMAQGARAGVARDQLLGFTEAAAKMGVAFDVSSEEAAAMMSTWRTAFGLEQAGVQALANQVNALTNAHGGNAAAVAEMVTRIGPLGDVAGASSGILAGLSQVMNSVGVESEVGATGIKNLLLGMTKGESATKSQAKAFKALGLDTAVMAKRMQTDAAGAIMTVLEAIAKLPKDKQLSTLGEMFGTESVAAISPLLSQLDLVKRNFREVGDAQFYAGSMDKEYAARANTTSTAVQLAKNNASALAVEIGSGLLPMIKGGAAALAGMATQVRDFSAAHPKAMKVVALLVGIVAAALLVFGGLAMAVAAILGPFALMQLVLTQVGLLFGPLIAGLTGTGAAAGGAAVGISAMLLPVLAVIAAIALLVGAAILIRRNWSTIGPWLSKLWDGISAVIGGAVRLIQGYIMNFTPLGFLIRNWGPITNFMGALWGAIRAVVGLGLDYIRLGLANFLPLQYFIAGWSTVTGWVAGFWRTLGGLVTSGIAGIKSAIASFQPLQDFQAAFANVWTWMQGLPGRMLNAGADAIRGFTQGLRGQRASVQAAAADAAGRAEVGARRRLDTHSPSRVFAAIGQDVMDGFSVGIAANAASPARHMRSAAAAIAAAGLIGAPGAASAISADFAARPRIDAVAPPQMSGEGQLLSGARSSAPREIHVHIHAAPGMNEERLVQLAMERLRQETGAVGSASYDDTPGSWSED